MTGTNQPMSAEAQPRAILFDLDGTLIDSVPDLTTSVNILLEMRGEPPLSTGEVRAMVGNGIAKLVERAFAARGQALAGERLEVEVAAMMEIYGRHLVDKTTLLPGAADILAFCAEHGIAAAVVTNKPEALSRRIVSQFGLDAYVTLILGGDSGPARKPAPDMLLHTASALGLPVSGCVMVGDSPADIDAAKAAVMASVVVRGGYTTIPVEELGADLVIDALPDLPQALTRLGVPA
ncbi:phosphoglycolate phosphatase [Stappia taiwanensis]|uniref:Phosphoglycolate phosphatase n=1 Tax=Stappia taiwanensis TaxID=992267 RepID=A0A838XF44_9HYPH|nr:phosphoglycolate phosphatase [Stappia taiwanensis]MBA4610079.1 phosphoglycolate phosphatase [Stappia taiwanensis]GGE76755.1 phosphoglycolate phosphatase, bacterial [Stappia taiwanensis]